MPFLLRYFRLQSIIIVMGVALFVWHVTLILLRIHQLTTKYSGRSRALFLESHTRNNTKQLNIPSTWLQTNITRQLNIPSPWLPTNITRQGPTTTVKLKRDWTKVTKQWLPYTFDNGTWRQNTSVCQNIKPLYGKKTFQKFRLNHVNKPMRIYTFDPKVDWISNSIRKVASFEPIVFKMMYHFIREEPEAQFIDIGANLGVFSLQMADVGKRVIAIEISRECVQHMCASIIENKHQDKITLIHNAISNNHKKSRFVQTTAGNYGINFVESNETRKSMHIQFSKNLYKKKLLDYNTIILNDVLTLPAFQGVKKVFIKMDVEGLEHRVLQMSEYFFKHVTVMGLYMEWNKHFFSGTGDYIVEVMKSRGFEHYDCERQQVQAKLKDHVKNPCSLLKPRQLREKRMNILWLPQNVTE